MATNSSRIINTGKNIFTSLTNQIISLILNFVSRTVFIHYLNAEYLGINGLFSNILQVLSMADLGFNTAIVYSMYKPLNEDNKQELSALMTFYQKIYNIIAISVFAIGMLIIPILPYIVKIESNIPNLTLYYILYLLDTVISYLFVYKTSITTADQKSYLLNNYDSIFIIIQNILQIFSLIIFKNFAIYLSIKIFISLTKNIYKAKKSENLYPYIKNKVELDNKTKKTVFENVKSMFIYKIGGVILNNTDNILISITIGTIVVGYYSNYLMIINAVLMFTNLMFNSITASIGNVNVSEDSIKKILTFKRINFITIWLFIFCGICFLNLFDDFIVLWLGTEYLLDKKTLIAIVLNFVMPGSIRPVSLYRDTTGLFHKTKYVFFITSIINLILSIILGNLYGLYGILISTAIARLLTNMWFEPYILFKEYFKLNPWKHYFKKQLIYWIVFLAISIITYNICILFTEISILIFIVKILICILIPNIIFYFIFKKSDELNYFKNLILNLLHKNNIGLLR